MKSLVAEKGVPANVKPPVIKIAGVKSEPLHYKSGESMNALVYHGPGKKSWEQTPKPVILETTDAVVKIENNHLRHRPPYYEGGPSGSKGRKDIGA